MCSAVQTTSELLDVPGLLAYAYGMPRDGWELRPRPRPRRTREPLATSLSLALTSLLYVSRRNNNNNTIIIP